MAILPLQNSPLYRVLEGLGIGDLAKISKVDIEIRTDFPVVIKVEHVPGTDPLVRVFEAFGPVAEREEKGEMSDG
jgi:hypothetical protein